MTLEEFLKFLLDNEVSFRVEVSRGLHKASIIISEGAQNTTIYGALTLNRIENEKEYKRFLEDAKVIWDIVIKNRR